MLVVEFSVSEKLILLAGLPAAANAYAQAGKV